MKRQLLTIALLLTPISALLAQENKHAQAMHTAFVETINGKFPKNIKAKLESMNEDSATVADGTWGCLDGGGLVPKEKIHVVTLSKSKSNVTADIGPLYIDGHRFEFERVPLLLWFFPVLLMILLFVMMFRSMRGGVGGGMFNIGKSKAQVYDSKTAQGVSFKDVAGLEGAKEEVEEIVDFLKNPKKYTVLGGKIPKGALLVGPPGTGKTLLAKAVAGEAKVLSRHRPCPTRPPCITPAVVLPSVSNRMHRMRVPVLL